VRQQIYAIGDGGGRDGSAGGGAEGGQHIHRAHGLREGLPGAEFRRPADDKWDADAAFEDFDFLPA